MTYGRFFHYTMGMDKIGQVTQLINHWKPRQRLASTIGAEISAVHKWASFNRIPSEWQAAVVQAAQSEGLTHVNGEWMVLHHARPASAKRPERAA